VNNMGTARYSLAGGGIQTNTLAFGGRTATVNLSSTEQYDGTTWLSVPSMTTARGSGIQTAALVFGGGLNQTIEYNGTSWTAVPATLATSRGGMAGLGTQTLALAAGGAGPTAVTEEYTNPTLEVV